MKMPTKIIIFLMLIISSLAIKSNAQTFKNFDKKLERKIDNAIERKVNRHIDKTINTIDKETDKEISDVKKGNKNNKEEKTSDLKKSNSLEEIDEEGENEINFKRGSRIIFSDNFEKDATGDFPAKWNSTLSGEVKKLKGHENKFLKIPAKSIVNPELTKALPENFTIEYDLIIPNDVPIRMASVGFGPKPKDISNLLTDKNAVHFSFQSYDNNYAKGIYYGRQGFTPGVSFTKVAYDVPLNKMIKVAFAVNGKRIRMYVDGQKKVDMPSAFDATLRKSIYFQPSVHGNADTKLNYFYISNVVIAEAGNDERSQVLKDLLEKGSFSTNAILFATGSDVIENSSNDIINQLVAAMNEAPELKLKIVGHTDNVGDKNKNLSLSSKRANAVKMALVKKGINPSKLVNEGKGDSEPISNNNSEDGKAQNRRVEFIKIN
ncbi:MAG: OmpA family protein [Chitinophagaceae bacterium]|nr:OmpA family protein [Chitinophagaceae bacterium]